MAAGLAGRTYRINIGMNDNVSGPLHRIIAQANVSLGLLKLGGGTTGAGGGVTIMNNFAPAAQSSDGGNSLWDSLTSTAGLVDSLMSIYGGVKGTAVGDAFSTLGTSLVQNVFRRNAYIGKHFASTGGSGAGGYVGKHFANTASAGSGLSGIGGSATVGALGTLGATAGGVIGAATLFSGVEDVINATNTEGAESTYNAWKGGSKIGGVLGGAAIGTAILPGVGTLIGAGIGGLVGIFGGEALASGVSGYDEEEIKRQEELAEAVSGHSDMYKNLINSTKMTAAEFKALRDTKIEEWYGDVSISAAEASTIVKHAFEGMVGSETLMEMEQYQASIERLAEAKNLYQAGWDQSQRIAWKIEAGIELEASDSVDYVGAIDAYIHGVEETLLEHQFNLKLAMNLILGTEEDGSENPMIEQTMGVYEGISSQVSGLKKQIYEEIQKGWNEESGDYNLELINTGQISKWQEEINDVMAELNAAQQEADFATMKLKYGDGNLDKQSMGLLDAELNDYHAQYSQANLDAYNRAYQGLVLARDRGVKNGGISQDDFDTSVGELQQGYYAGEVEISRKVGAFKYEMSSDAITNAQESITELQKNMYDTIDTSDVNWETMAIANDDGTPPIWDNLQYDKMFVPNPEVLEGLKNEAAVTVAEMGEEVMSYLDQDMEPPQELIDNYMASLEALDFASLGTTYWEKIAEIAKNNGFEGARDSMIEQGKIIPGGFAEGIANGDMDAITAAVAALYTDTDGVVQEGFKTPYDVLAQVNIMLQKNIQWVGGSPDLTGSSTDTFEPWDPIKNPLKLLPHKANGGIVGSTTLSWLAEEGWPEAVIPFDPKRRHRALGLWQETGKRLGVLENAAGGIVGDYGRVSIPEFSAGSGSAAGGGSAITIGDGAVQISVKAAEGQSVTEIISENLENIGAQVAEVIVQKLEPQFENTPMRAG